VITSGAGERGLTLTELVIVIALAGVVTLGLVSFYFNSQTIWVDGSTQAMTQREATHIVQSITDSIHRAVSANVFVSPDTLHEGLQLVYPDGSHFYFWWSSTDSLVHHGPRFAEDQGPIGDSKVMGLELNRDSSLVYLRRLELRSANGQFVQLASSAALLNRVQP
jgi:prepilin-type N-terminal cleavage/methylation domain-containing protein